MRVKWLSCKGLILCCATNLPRSKLRHSVSNGLRVAVMEYKLEILLDGRLLTGMLIFVLGVFCGAFSNWILMRQSENDYQRRLLHNNRALTARVSDMSQAIEELEEGIALHEYAKEKMINVVPCQLSIPEEER